MLGAHRRSERGARSRLQKGESGAGVAQVVRAAAFRAPDHGFDSRRPLQKTRPLSRVTHCRKRPVLATGVALRSAKPMTESLPANQVRFLGRPLMHKEARRRGVT